MGKPITSAPHAAKRSLKRSRENTLSGDQKFYRRTSHWC
jgi:hypothetical protein